MLRYALVSALFALAPVNAAHAQIQTATGELEVRLLVTAACEVSGSTSGAIGSAVLDFGTTDLLLAAIDADTGTSGVQTFDVLCNPGIDYSVAFDAGQNATDIANRAMRRDGGMELVNYQLYTSAARTTVLSTLTGTGTGTATPIQVYGRVPAQAAPVPGNYRDIVTVTLTF